MHALASQGRLKDIGTDVMHEFQCTSALPELPVNSTAGVIDRTNDCYVDYVSCRSATENTSWLRDDVVRSSVVLPPAPLQRLEHLESDLASLNHTRRRLAADDEAVDRSLLNSTRHNALTGPTTQFDGSHGDVMQSADNTRSVYTVATGGVGDLNVPQWISSAFRDIATLQRRQMCGGNVLSTSEAVVTNCLQSPAKTSATLRAPVDAVSSLARFTDTRFQGCVNDEGQSPSKYHRDTMIGARICTENKSMDSQYEEGACSLFPQTPAKQEQRSPRLDPAAEYTLTPVSGISRLDSHYVPGTCCRNLAKFCVVVSNFCET